MKWVLLLLTSVLASAQNVRITWVGQACFYVQTEGGPIVVTDPPANNIGYTLPTTPADAVTVSHDHGDHNNSAGVRGTPVVLDGRTTTTRTESTAAGMPFLRIPGFHDATSGTQRGRNTIVKWTQGGLRFAHFGDYGQSTLTEAQLEDLRDIDVAMIPAGGFFTIDGAGVKELVQQFRPKIAILMHFRTAIAGPAQLPTSPAVASAFPDVRFKPSTVTLTRATVPTVNEVWVLEPSADASVTNAAGLIGGAPLAPGSLATLWGPFTGSATGSFPSFPLGRKLGETEVFLGTEALPLLYISPTQINFQIPSRLTPGQYLLEVRVGGTRVTRGTVTVVDRSPGLFVSVDENGRINQARRNGFITIYGSGQGVVTNSPADGTAAGADPLSRGNGDPVVSIGGRRAIVTYSGLAPGFVGLWQINAQLAFDTQILPNQDLVVLFDANLPSNAIKVAVE